MKLNKLFTLLLIVLITVSCSNDDSSASNSSIRAKIGNIQWNSSDNTSSLTQIASLGQQRYDLTAWDENYKIVLAISENNIDNCMSVGSYTNDNLLLWFYYGVGNGSYVSEHSDEILGNNSIVSDIIVNVTSCTNNTISGTFSGTFYKNGDLSGLNTPEIVTITDGVLSNVPYTLYEN